VLVQAEFPSYAASKAALSNYFEGLGLALRPHGVAVSNLRLGFVDTKMARASVRPFMYTLDQAVDVVESVLRKRPLRLTRALSIAPLVRLLAWISRWRVLLARGPACPGREGISIVPVTFPLLRPTGGELRKGRAQET